MFRYEIVHWYETEDSHDAVTEVLTRAVDVDGLFSDQVPRPVTLIGVEHPERVQPLVGPGGYFGREFNAFKDCLGGGWLKLLQRYDVAVEPKSPQDGVGEPRETLMWRALADRPAPEPPVGCEVRVTSGEVIEVVLSVDGAEAASGLLAVIGEDAVPHRIRTSPEHRRRGPCSVVMGLLAREAVKAGAEDGLLFATGDGLHLYRKLGWATISDVVIASRTQGEA